MVYNPMPYELRVENMVSVTCKMMRNDMIFLPSGNFQFSYSDVEMQNSPKVQSKVTRRVLHSAVRQQ